MARNGIKSGGRTKGTPNKKTVEQLDRVEKVLQVIEDKYLMSDLQNISSGQRMNLYADLVEYKLPKLTRTDHRIQGNINISDEPVVFE